MKNKGLKIVKEGKSINSTNIDDYNYWSKYPSLILLEKKEVDIIIGSGGCSGTRIVEHNFNFIPVVQGTVRKIAGSPVADFPKKFFMPVGQFESIGCGGDFFITNLFFNYIIKKNRVEINYIGECIQPMVGSVCPTNPSTFRIELYFYMWELGSKWPI